MSGIPTERRSCIPPQSAKKDRTTATIAGSAEERIINMSAQEEVLGTLHKYKQHWKDMDLDKFMDLYAEDIVFGYQGEPPGKGKQALRNSIQQVWASGARSVFRKNFHFDQVTSDIALTMNLYDQTDASGAVTSVAEIKDFIVWKKVDGRWLIWRDTMSTSK